MPTRVNNYGLHDNWGLIKVFYNIIDVSFLIFNVQEELLYLCGPFFYGGNFISFLMLYELPRHMISVDDYILL